MSKKVKIYFNGEKVSDINDTLNWTKQLLDTEKSNDLSVREWYVYVIKDLNTKLYYSDTYRNFSNLGNETLLFLTFEDAQKYFDTAIEHALHKKFIEYCKLENIIPKYKDEVKYQKLHKNDYKLTVIDFTIRGTYEQ